MFLDYTHYYLEIQGLNLKKTGLNRNDFELQKHMADRVVADWVPRGYVGLVRCAMCTWTSALTLWTVSTVQSVDRL